MAKKKEEKQTKLCPKCGKQQALDKYIENSQWCNPCRKKYIKTPEQLENFCNEFYLTFNIDIWNQAIEKFPDDEPKAIGKYFSLMNMPQNQSGEASISNESDPSSQKKIFSAIWMGNFTPFDIEYLENYYSKLEQDYKIVTVNHKDYARKIAKASLHMDKCFQEALDGKSDKKFKDAKEVFDTLCKSAQFNEASRGQNDVSLGCFGVTFEKVEKKKWVPQHIPLEKDAIDKLIDQFNHIKKSVT